MKNSNLLNRLWKTDSHEKQKPQRFARYAAMLIMLLTLGVGQMWATTSVTVYCAINASTMKSGDNCYTLKVNANIGDNNTWVQRTMSIVDKTKSGKLIYSATFSAKYDGVDALQFQLYNGSSWVAQRQPYSSWTTASTFNGKMYDYDAQSWGSYSGFDATTTVYFVNTSSWATPKAFAWSGCTNNAAWSGQTMTSTGKTYNGKTIYSISFNKRFENIIFSNNGSSQTADLTLGSTNAGKMYDNGTWRTYNYDVTVSFNLQGHGSAIASKTVLKGSKVTAPSDPSASGYTFGGWYKEAGCTNAWNFASDVVSADKELFAKWTENMSTVSFVASPTEKGTFQVNSSTVTSTTAGVTTTRSVTAVPGTGYTFGSWAITGGATISSTSTNPTTVTGGGAGTAATLTCTFNPKQCTITFDKNGGANGDNGTTGTYDAAMPTITPPTRDHYTFAGYWDAETNNNGSGTQYYNADGTSTRNWNKNTTSATTLYAKWTEITHAVRAHSTSGGSSTPTSWTNMGEVTGGSVTASNNTGYHFVNWTIDDSKGGSFTNASSASTTFFPTEDDTWITAHFAANTYSISLDKNGGDSDGSVTATYNSGTLTSFSGAAYAGYSCDGYFTADEGGVMIIDASGNLQSNKSGYTDASGNWTRTTTPTTLYAHWTEDATYYTLTYGVGTSSSGNVTVSAAKTSDASAISSGSSLVSGTGVTITATPATHYKFVGWYTTAACVTRVSTNNPYSFSLEANTNLYAKVELMTTTVTFNKNGGSGSTPSTLTATHGSNSLSSGYVAPTKTGYTFNGWYDDASSGSKVFGTNGVITASSGYADGSSNWTYTGTTLTVYAHWTAKNYTVTLNKQSGSGGPESVSATYDADMPSTTMPTRTGYDFNGYYGSTGGSGTKYYNSDGSSAHVWDVASATSIYAYWTAHNYSITYSPSSAPTGCTYTTKPTSADYNTTVDMVITPSTGYTVSVSAVDASSNVVTVTPGANNHYTFTQPASAVTVTVTATEIMSTLSTSCSYDAGDPEYADPTKSASSIGIATTSTLTATTPSTGYTFAGWTLSDNIVVTSGDKDADLSITIRSNGNGAAASAQAKYNEVLTQNTWIVAGGNKIVTTGTTWRTTADANNSMVKKTGHANESVVYFTVPVTTVCSGDHNENFQFKIYNTSTSKWYGLFASGDSYYLLKAEDGTAKSLVEDNKNIELRAYVTGDYEFKLDYTTSTPKLTVTWPVFNQVRISAASPSDAGNVGDYDLSDPVENVRSVKRTLKANTTYTFKIVYNSDFYGYNSGTFTRSTSTSSNSRTISTSGGDMTLTTDYAGDYTFKFNQSTKALSIDFPEAYKVTYGKGAVDGSSGNSCSAKDIDNGNASVTSNNTWVKKDHRVVMTAPDEDGGYTFDGWFDNNSSTGDAITTAKNCTITVASAATYYACYHEHKTAITINTDGHGTIITPDPNDSPYSLGVATSQAINATASTGYHWNTWTTSGNAALVSSATTQSNTVKGNGTEGGTGTVTATFTPNTYRVQFHRNGGAGDVVYQDFTYDAAQNLTANTYTKTGYNFAGWALSADAAVTYADEASVSNLTATNNGTYHLYAKWTPKTTTITYSQSGTGYGSGGQSTTQTATYDAAMPTPISTPTAANGYAFMGYYDALEPLGTQYYDETVASARTWNKEDATATLYAYFKKAEVTGITFSPAAVVAPNATITVTPTIDPEPEGTTTVCWRVLYSNGNPLAEQPTFTPVSGNTVSFPASATSGSYKLEAVLHLGSGCGGEELSTYEANFQVAGDHTVTVQYLCGGEAIKASETMIARPLEWSDDITAPSIFGYTFNRWVALDGVSIKDHANDTSTTATIKIKATYDGRLKAEYVQNDMIYFKNTLGWSDVYVNFYTSSYWNNPKGSGNKSVTNRNKHMTRIGDTDVWYYDYGAESISPSLYVSFTDMSQNNYENFSNSSPHVQVVYPANYQDAIHTDKSSENGFKPATPMFVPLANQTATTLNSNADYYNRGYWTTYTEGTGYTLEIYYDNDASSCIQSIPFTSADDLMPMKAVVDLEASSTYRYQVRRGGTESNGIYYGNTGTMTYDNHGAGTGWDLTNTMAGGFKKAKITTNASGNYTFNLSYSANTGNNPQYRLRMEVDYPIANGDYRVIYKDNVQTKDIKSAIVTKANNSKDTVSFFIRPNTSPVLKIQQASVTNAGDITWGDLSDISSSVTSLPKDSVYNICLTMNGSGVISVENVEGYTGDFYIRTNSAGASKWDNYRSADHLMTYSQYSEQNADYSHYFMAYVGDGTNLKFVVANDYAPNISDTLAQATEDASHVNEYGDVYKEANIRFMWDRKDNSIGRAYLAPAKSDGSKFLVLRANSSEDLMDEFGNALLESATSGQAGYNHGAPNNSIQFVDDDNWIYETTVKVKPSAYVKLYAYYHDVTHYYKGEANDDFDKDNAIQLMTGTGDAEKLHVIYDFKTDRLMAAWMPSGNISEEREINADVMFLREHQDDIQQLTFTGSGAITEIKTAYAVLRFNKWTINNKSQADGHAVLNPGASRYERDMFYVSFPFRVAMNEVFGFGKYGKHWIIEYYDGAARALNGFWADTPTYWRFVTDRKGKFFEPNQGYIIALDLDEMGESSEVWDNGVENVELYFPSYGTMGNITNATVEHTLPEHTCSINRPTPDGDRTIKDSHWNVMSVPTYVNTSSVEFANTTWTADCPSFLYEWNMGDNSLTPRSGSGYTYHAMHAYIVQYAGKVTWKSTSVTPASAPNRNPDAPADVEYRIELQQNDVAVDQAFVKLSNEENVSAGFAFGEDMSKEFNKNRSNIYTFIGKEQVAGNCLPMSEQTTVVPVGVIAKTTGDYTFALPEGTNGVGVTLVDNETGIRTPLSALDYTVNLTAGTYNERFVLEISPIHHMPTGIENSEVSHQHSDVRKVLIDGILYIVKDGKMFDARGARVQ